MNKKDDEVVKKHSVNVKLTDKDFSRLKRACFRDELKLAEFARGLIIDGIDNLIKKQEKVGYKCQQAI